MEIVFVRCGVRGEPFSFPAEEGSGQNIYKKFCDVNLVIHHGTRQTEPSKFWIYLMFFSFRTAAQANILLSEGEGAETKIPSRHGEIIINIYIDIV